MVILFLRIMVEKNNILNRRNVVAVVWDFDKTLIRGYMQAPLFRRYGVDEKRFWLEVNQLPEIYARRGVTVSRDTVYLNHLLSFIKNGPMKGLQNRDLRDLGKEQTFYPGLPEFFRELREVTHRKKEYRKHDIHLEHYIISTGLAEIIRGSAIAPEVEGIYGCEFVESPLPPHFSRQDELAIEMEFEISQVGVMVDNTAKTRYVFEINKGTNKNPDIDVNARIAPDDRRVPISNMIYIADGPSDIPVFSVVKRNGGKTFAVYDQESSGEFAQNDALQQDGRVDSYGPADYRTGSQTSRWLKLQVELICDRIVREKEEALNAKVGRPPRHLHDPEPDEMPRPDPGQQQEILFSD